MNNTTTFSKKEQEAYDLGYRVTVDGLVVAPSGRVLQPFFKNSQRDYPAFSGYRKLGKIKVHRLVAYQKWGEDIYRHGVEVRHLDGDITNFSVDNLALGTHQQNALDIPKERRLDRAQKAGNAVRKYDAEKRQEIRRFYVSTRSYKHTMARFGISSSVVQYIVNGWTGRPANRRLGIFEVAA